MLLFIWEIWHNWSLSGSVSIHPMLLFISHTQYHIFLLCPFQYIPCYSLSELIESGAIAVYQFQYIPCYSLSRKWGKKSRNARCFNTSHVTLYHMFGAIHIIKMKVSIHPMLLFICAGIAGGNARIEFQYIPCYSLSGVRLYRSGQNQVSIHPMLLFIYSHCSWHAHEHGVSIHPMLLFIRYSQYKVWSENRVSIHPMLLFIWKSLPDICSRSGFNTSHVTLYQLICIEGIWINQCFNTSHVTLYPFSPS